MRDLCQELGEQTKVKIDFMSQDLPSPLPPDISLCLFRVLQESLRNAVKHSGARHVEVGLWGTPDEIYLAVADRGMGFDIEAAKKSQRAWPGQHGGAAETIKGNAFHRIATQSWHNDPG